MGDGGGDILRHFARCIDGERFVVDAQKSGADTVVAAAADGNERRQRAIQITDLTGDVRGESRVFDAAGRNIASVHLVGRAAVVAFFVGHRADERDVLHHGRGLFPAVGDLNAGDGRVDCFGRSAVFRFGFGVECFKMAGSARHPQENHRHSLLAKLLGVQAHDVAEIHGTGRHRSGGKRLQKSAARKSVAGNIDRLVMEQIHVSPRSSIENREFGRFLR